jgi:pimeloyl-ACP methyl ester carboxylesterase
MPIFERSEAGARLYYEEHGEGFPVLLFAPGGMRSNLDFWQRTPWNPITALSPHFRVIAMDQRNAGRSSAPVRASDGWHAYAEDHLALLDHLGIARCHVLGGCIGGSFCLALIEAAPERVAAAVLQQPIGLSSENRDTFYALFDGWAAELRGQQPEVASSAWGAFRERMYGGDFVFCVDRDFVRRCAAPMLVLMGNDIYHPSDTSRELAALTPHGELIERWKDADVLPGVVAQVLRFLQAHEPSGRS